MKNLKLNSAAVQVFLLCILLSPLNFKIHAQWDKRIIVRSGQAAAGTDSAVFRTLGNPTPVGVSNDGRILFNAMLEPDVGDATWGNLLGTWADRNGELSLVYREGEVPGVPGQVFRYYPKMFMDPSGQVAMEAEYSPTGDAPFTHGFFMEENGSMALKVYDGMTVFPGVTLGGFGEVDGFNMGSAIFTAYLVGEGVDTDNNNILAMVDQGGFTILCREGDPMPLEDGKYRNYAMSFQRTLNINGSSIVSITGRDTTDNPTNQYVTWNYIWSRSGGFSFLVDPGLSLEFPFSGTFRINSSGSVLARSGSGFDSSVSLKKGNGFSSIASTGDTADGSGGSTFARFGVFPRNFWPKSVVHENDIVTVFAETSDNEMGAWTGDETGLKKVIRTSEHAPGMPDFMFLSKIVGMEANTAGQVAIYANAAGIDKSDPNKWINVYNTGIWLGDADVMELAVHTEEQIELEPGLFKTISYVGMATSFYGSEWDDNKPRTGADGWPSNLNDKGQVAFSVKFQEGGNALMVASRANPFKVDFSKIENGPPVSGAEIPENGIAYLYFNARSNGSSLFHPDTIHFSLLRPGAFPVDVTGIFLESGLFRVNLTSEGFSSDPSDYKFPSSLRIGDTLYTVNNPIPTFSISKKPPVHSRSWDVFAGGSAGVSGSVGSIGLGASASAAKLSIKGEGGVGLKMQLDEKGNILIDRRVDYGIREELEAPQFNYVVGEVNVGKAEVAAKTVIGQSFQFTDLAVDENLKNMAQAGFMLETFSIGGLGLSPFVGLVLSALTETINTWSNVNTLFSSAAVEDYWGLGAEGSFGIGLKFVVGEEIEYNVVDATFGGAIQAKYVEKNRSPGSKGTLAGSSKGAAGSSLEMELAAEYNIVALPFALELFDGVELGSGNFSLFDNGLGGSITLAADRDVLGDWEGFSIGLKGGGQYSVLGEKENTYYNSKLEFSREHISTLKTGSTSIGTMLNSAALIPLSPVVMSRDVAVALEEVLTAIGEIPVRITTSETRGKSYDLGLGISFDIAAGVGLGGSVGIKGSYFDELAYPKKVSDVYLGHYNYLLSSSDYTAKMKEASFTGIMETLFSGTLPLIKSAFANFVEVAEKYLAAGQEFLEEIYSKTEKKVGELIGKAPEFIGKLIFGVFSADSPRVMQKAFSAPEVKQTYISSDVYHKSMSKSGAVQYQDAGTILTLVSDVLTFGFVPDGDSLSIDSLETPLDLKLIIYEENLTARDFTSGDKDKVKIYYYHTDSIGWLLEGGTRDADTVRVAIFRTGTYALGIESDVSIDKSGPTIFDWGTFPGLADDNTPEIYAHIADERFGSGIDLSKSYLLLNGDTVDTYFNPTDNKIFYQVPDTDKLYDGTYQVEILAADLAGNLSSETFSFTLEGTRTAIEKYGNQDEVSVISMNFPNPFAGFTTISFRLDMAQHIEINIYDFKGAYVKRLLSGTMPAGEHSINWDGTNSQGNRLSPGTYFYQVKTDSFNVVRKMLFTGGD